MFDYEKGFIGKNLSKLESMDYDTSVFKMPEIYKFAVDLMFKHNTLTYSDFGGFDRFKKLIKKYEKRLADNVEYDNFVFVGPGVSSLIYPVVESLLELKKNRNRRKIIVFEPDYPLFKSVIERLGAIKVPVKGKRENNFLVNYEDLKKNIDNEVCAIIFSYPNNPTCQYQERDFFEKTVKICKEKDIFILSDEIYRETFYKKDDYVNIVSINKGYNNFVRFFGWSKDRPGMTGMRAAYCIGDTILKKSLLNNHVLRNFSGNIISEYVFMIDIALRYFKLTGEEFEDFKYYPKKLIKNYFGSVDNNFKRQIRYNNLIYKCLNKRRHVTDTIEPKSGNSIFFRFKENLSCEKFYNKMISRGIAIYPYDIFSLTQKDGSWTRICITKNIKTLKMGVNKI